MAQSSIGLPPDSTGKKLHTHTHDIDGETVHNQIFSLGDTENHNFQSIDEYGAATVRFANGGMDFDAYGKTKMTEETPISSFSFNFDAMEEDFSYEVTGTASYSYNTNQKAVVLSVGSDADDKIVMTSNRYHKHLLGVSNTIMLSGMSGDNGKAGLTRRRGYYDDNDGFFFEIAENQLYVVVRSSASGSVVETRIAQADFNGDKADGTGVSGIQLVPSFANTYWMDFQFPAGTIRFGGLAPDGTKILAHTVYNANSMNLPYMKTASLPVRSEMFNTAGTSGTSELKILSKSVISDSANPSYKGVLKLANTGLLGDLVPVANGFTNCLSIRTAELFNGEVNRTASIPVRINVYCTKIIGIRVVKNAVMSNEGTATWQAGQSEAATNFSGDLALASPSSGLGEAIYSTMINNTNQIDLQECFSYLTHYLRANADGTCTDTYSILVKTIVPAETDDIMIGIHWDEVYM